MWLVLTRVCLIKLSRLRTVNQCMWPSDPAAQRKRFQVAKKPIQANHESKSLELRTVVDVIKIGEPNVPTLVHCQRVVKIGRHHQMNLENKTNQCCCKTMSTKKTVQHYTTWYRYNMDSRNQDSEDLYPLPQKSFRDKYCTGTARNVRCSSE